MNVTDVPDDGGDTIPCVEYNEYLFPKFPDTTPVRDLRSVKIRDDDVLLYTYPKSGSHWIYEITRELLTGEIFNDTVSKGSSFMEMTPEKEYVDLPSPRILNTHAVLAQLPVDVVKKKIKIINTIRNPKDVAVSLYNFSLSCMGYKGKWENFLRPYALGKFFYGSWFDAMKYWETMKTTRPDLPIHTVFYEDLQQDQIGEMRKICQFLGIERSDEYLEKVRQNTGLAKMRSLKPLDELNVFRKGQVGDWKNWFTVAQNEWFDQLYQEEMKDCPLDVYFTLDQTTTT